MADHLHLGLIRGREESSAVEHKIRICTLVVPWGIKQACQLGADLRMLAQALVLLAGKGLVKSNPLGGFIGQCLGGGNKGALIDMHLFDRYG